MTPAHRVLAADLAGRPLDESPSTLVRMPARSARLPSLDEQEARACRREADRRWDERLKRAEREAARAGVAR